MKKILLIGSEGTIAKEVQKLFSKKKLLCTDIIYSSQIKDENKFFLNISSNDSIENFIQKINNRYVFHGIVYLIGEKNKKNFFNCTIEEWEQTFSLNITRFFALLKMIYPSLDKTCSIVTVASQNGVVGHEDRVAYGPSKAALIQLTKNLTIDFSAINEKDIRINTVSPSYIAENNINNFFDTYPGKILRNRIPNKKLIPAREVAALIAFLLSSKASSIRGQNITIDNGYTVR